MKRSANIATKAAIAALVVLFLLTRILEYTPLPIEDIEVIDNQGEPLGDTVTIFSWNLGYCGYDSNMDFFYDGGKQVRASEKRTKINLRKITEELQKHRDADFILLQEVDLCSKRSYRMNCLDSICKVLPEFTPYYAANFRSPFVPIPFEDPIGKVESGVVILTRHPVIAARRYSLPDLSPYPQKIFELKRCILECEVATTNGDTLHLFNLHNSAYDNGSKRKAELMVIDSLARKKQISVFVGDWNCNPPGYKQSEKEKNDPYFSPVPLKEGQLAVQGFLADEKSHTMRYLDEPYVKGRTAESLLDFMGYTIGVEPLEAECIDLGFANSDHNPVVYKIAINPEVESR